MKCQYSTDYYSSIKDYEAIEAFYKVRPEPIFRQ
jgi:hypothetical protein